MTTESGKAERTKRIHEIRQWGTTEDAENAALSIMRLLPDGLAELSIFPAGVDQDSDTGDGGISLQRSTDNGAEVAVIVEIDSSGCITGWRLDSSTYSEAGIATCEHAAEYLTNVSLELSTSAR